MLEKYFTIIKTSEPKDAIVDIEIELSAEKFEQHRKDVLRAHSRDLKLPGFRPGHIPADVAEKHLDPQHILKHAAEHALQEQYHYIVEEACIDPISSPRVQIQNMQKGSPLVCTLSIAVRPDVLLPNYKKIATKIKKEQKPIEITDSEVQEFVQSIKKSQKNAGEDSKMSDEELEKNVRETMQREKELEQKQNHRTNLQKELAQESKVHIPALLVEDEFATNIRHIQRDLRKMGVTIEDYLKKMRKSEEEFVKESQASLEEQLKVKFILSEIAGKEHIEPDESELKEQLTYAYAQYPNALKDRVQESVREALTYRKTLEFLERAEF
ncbi:hypothetical protein A2755_02160 [Candidatus Wolfebacteria bacterium RIFCSPHIGHO2_01_FULL_48_22]|uniref:Trigger factor n=2 Tax=Candidatus Wolfeibacteriota TaxID=1752735 RepID=A0A1F8DTP5_9BACT|nr:MAG: hypothetical protein A2755_02160 [Candidatus Wolfebacteria bacterium RIFCSPHIGHO2_01_FULL_48_22]OGM92312.1 MAG: hypothetical protein A2935_00910 [Candidatus Wolfebacteria bacterium RIFCSPLOWO2_01_FULL_47_17b]